MRILLVEDDKELCEAIKLQLEKAGMKQTAAVPVRKHFIMPRNFHMM